MEARDMTGQHRASVKVGVAQAQLKKLSGQMAQVLAMYGPTSFDLLGDLFSKLSGHEGTLLVVALQKLLQGEQRFADTDAERLRGTCQKYFAAENDFSGVLIAPRPKGTEWLLAPTVSDIDFDKAQDQLAEAIGDIHFEGGFEPKYCARPVGLGAAWMRPGKKLENKSVQELRAEHRLELYVEEAIAFLVVFYEKLGQRYLLPGYRIACLASTDSNGDVAVIEGIEDGVRICMVAPYVEQPKLSQPEMLAVIHLK